MRLFAAVSVPDSVKQHARMVRNELGSTMADVKWVDYKNYHLTIKFLGEVNEERLPAIKESLRLAADSSPAFHLSAGGIGFFPNRIRPRVIWIGIKGEVEKAEFMSERVDAYLSTLGFEEEKEHRFHLTLGRFRSDNKIHEVQKKVEEIARKEKLISFKVEKFHLMKSSLNPGGPVYSVLESFNLNG